MIGYVLTGGIGDAILCVPVIKKFREYFDDKVAVVYFNDKLTPILSTIDGLDLRLEEVECWDVSSNLVYRLLSDCGLIMWNRFEPDNDGHPSFFYANDDGFLEFVRKKRELYLSNLSLAIGREEIKDIRNVIVSELLRFFSNELDYYADLKRFGFEVSYSDVCLKVPRGVKSKFERRIGDLGKYAILHDSRLMRDGSENYYANKSWYKDRWDDVSHFLFQKGLNVLQIYSDDQPVFSGAVPHTRIIGKDAQFFDYLFLIKNAAIYIGTDSWPGHTAIFFADTKFLLLKGAVSMRWDHEHKYSTIIRKGKCQACEYVSLDECIFGLGTKKCMNLIGVNDVKEEVINMLDN